VSRALDVVTLTGEEYDAMQEAIERLRELADSEGTRAVEYLRRARKAEADVAHLMLAEEGAKEAFGHVVDDSDRLKPCPFCGAEAEIITLEGETDEPSIGAQCVQCTSSACGAASGLIYPLMDDVTDLLRERWNKRHNAK
jgi:hypothetical protein